MADRCFARTRKASVDEGDDIDNYDAVLKKHINRMQVAEKVIAGHSTICPLVRRWPCMPWLLIPIGENSRSVHVLVSSKDRASRSRSCAGPKSGALLTSVCNAAELRPKMTEFHGKVGGDLAKIEALFTDMAPEPQKVKPPAAPCTHRSRPHLHTPKA